MKNPRVLGCFVGSLVLGAASSAGAAAPMAAPAPPAPMYESIVSGQVVATRDGTFATVLGMQSGATHVHVGTGPNGVDSVLAASGGGTVVATRGLDDGGSYVATAGAVVRRYRLLTSSGKPEARAEAQIANEKGHIAMSASDRTGSPLLAITEPGKTTIRFFGSETEATLSTPDNISFMSAVHSSPTGNLLAYPTAKGARVVKLGLDGQPTGDAPIELADSVRGLRTAIVALGDDALVAYWPNQLPEPHGAKVVRIAADGTSSEERTLEKDTVALIGDPDAPSAADAKLIRLAGTEYEESTWNAPGDAGPTIARKLPRVAGKFLHGACSAAACLYLFDNSANMQSYTLVLMPRSGDPTVESIRAPSVYGAGGGGRGTGPYPLPDPTAGNSSDPSNTSSGCSASPVSSGEGLLGAFATLGMLALAIRRRRA
jgi:hypothetical protein